MALTKLPKNAIANDAIDASKIEDGTIQAVEVSGTIPETKLATGTIENAKLSNSTITINGTSISLGSSVSVSPDFNWQSVITADGSTATLGVAGNGYFIDTTSAAHTFNLPASATLGDQIAIKDYAGTFASNNLTIGRNGHNIQGSAVDSLISTNRASLVLVYVDSTKGWIYAEESNMGFFGPAFISATGGTITESGDFKVHTFTGDGCFVVSSLGNAPTNPLGGPNNVDYLVIAGGGGGSKDGTVPLGGGGGGAGGYRESHSVPVSGCYTASPLATPTGITVSSTTYPITVGAGGAGATSVVGGCGSNSVFSTITSAGGGRGGYYSGSPGLAGGSGGGGGANGGSGGTGNTPPTSPPQGNNGSSGPPSNPGAGGGAGAAASGQDGGNGSTTSITSSPVTRAGGGASGVSGGTGGSGGGGSKDSDATENTGSGGGGGGGPPPAGSGGKGIVIIRYKFQ